MEEALQQRQIMHQQQSQLGIVANDASSTLKWGKTRKYDLESCNEGLEEDDCSEWVMTQENWSEESTMHRATKIVEGSTVGDVAIESSRR